MRDGGVKMGAQIGVRASVGFFSDPGPRPDNQDFAGAVLGWELPMPRGDVVAVIADGIGGAKGGRVAAETAVRGFLDGFCDLSETMPVQRGGAMIVNALNAWIYGQGTRDAALTGMGCAFTALVLRGRMAHILHAGDTRAYRMRGGNLTCLTADHVRKSADGPPVLIRAVGVEPEVRLDYVAQPVALHDRFLLCSDGVHGALANETLTAILRDHAAPEDTAKAVVAAALERSSQDNCTALVLDVVQLPSLASADIGDALTRLPLIATPSTGQAVDGFALKALISDGRFSRLLGALDEMEGGEVVLKFPKPQAASTETYHLSYIREAMAAARVNSPWVCRVIELAPARQSCLYTVMPLYQGELLEARLARRPLLGLEEGRDIAVKLARGAEALHRAGVIHRDIKPDNVILEGGGSLKLIDLGVVRIAELEDFPPSDIPGTLAYTAPEMSAGEAGNAATDIYALGVTLFRAFTGEFPYANADAVSPPRRERPQALCALRPDLPAWLEAALARAVAQDAAERFPDMTSFAVELEAGPAQVGAAIRPPRTFYERAPVLFWQIVAALLTLALVLSFLRG
jgi:serine/threonine protein phosphatase PrpC